jgi:ecotin
MMACPPEKTKEEYVRLPATGQLDGYNSKLPVVVYVPSDYEVRYRIWNTDN